MPWHVEKQDDKYCVIKDADGSTVHCHDSEEDAKAQVAALYASEDKEFATAPTVPFIVKAVDEPMPDEEATVEPETETEAEPADVASVDVPSGIRKLVVNLPGAETKDKALFGRIWDGVKQRLGWEDEDTATGFKVQGNHWLCVYSNNFLDRDKQLFPESAIDAYITRVDTGIVPPPELWVWHGGKNVAIGTADWVGRDGHFTYAAGQFYGGEAAKVAKSYYTKHAKDTGISHGFTFPEKSFDGKHFYEFNTFEISLLPRGVEANWFTSLEGIKAMPLDDKKTQYLKEVFGEEHAARILSDWDKRGKALEELGVEFKDFAGEALTSTAEATKAALENAEKSFNDLLAEILSTSSEPIVAARQAVKAAQASKAMFDDAMQQIDALRKEMDLRPRSASSDPATELDSTQGKGKELLDTIHAQMMERDPFTGLEVVKTP